MISKSWVSLNFLITVMVLFTAGCGAQSEPSAAEQPAPTPEPVVIVVTATEAPPTATPVVIVVTETPDVEPAVEEEKTEAPAATAAPKPTAEAVAEAPETEEAAVDVADEEQTAVQMSLLAQKTSTQHSPRQEPFVEPSSLEEIRPSVDWNDIQPQEKIDFQSYDGVRVLKGGEAVLNLGETMELILTNDSEMQIGPASVAEDELNRIGVEVGAGSPLEKLVLAAHLLRGGFLGEKTIGSDPIALTTPNAVVIISGTEFWLAYDPEAETSWAGNFGGTMSVADIEQQEDEPLPDRQLVVIPAVRDRKNWPLHENITPDEFSRLIDQVESPIAAAEMISGPYLRAKYDPEVALRNGPGAEFSYAGSLAKGEYARIIGRGRGWWQIECPPDASASKCWVAGGPAYTDDYNLDISPVAETAPKTSPTPKSTTAPAAPDAPQPVDGRILDCSYIGNDKYEWYSNEGGPFSGSWQPGCPASPQISINGCVVSWEAGGSDVRSATIGIRTDYYEELPASLPNGSRTFSLPSGFAGDVTASFNMILDNGQNDSKRVSRRFIGDCSGTKITEPTPEDPDPTSTPQPPPTSTPQPSYP